jgi:membrane protein implicated in regulation of membrane protease activity
MQRIFRQSAFPAARAIAAVAFLAAIGAAIPAVAADSQAPQVRVVLAAADVAPASAATTAVAARMDAKVEARIKDLHTRLAITATQEDSWGKVAQVMRDNEATMSTLIEARSGGAKTMTAVDDLKSYGQIAQAHADGIQKFAPVFGTLYDSMSSEQKANADSIFRDSGRKAAKHMAAKAG